MSLDVLLAARPGLDHTGAVRPLRGRDGWVLVDGRAICGTCGRSVEPETPDRWHHAGDEAAPLRESPWLAPVTADDLSAVGTYAEFAERFPWAVRADFGGPAVTTEDDWREATGRLAAYFGRLDELAGSGELPAGNPLLDLHGIVAGPPGPSPGVAQVVDLPRRRRELASRLAWAVPTDDALDVLADHGPLVEGGAGTGYWAALLRTRGVDVVAYDLHPPGPGEPNEYHPDGRRPWTRVDRASSVAAAQAHPDRTLLLCWPPDGDDAAGYDAVRAYRGGTVAYVGDLDGGTGSVRLHRELAANWTVVAEVPLPRWSRVRDRLFVHRRNPTRQRLLQRDRCTGCRRFLPTGATGRCDACFAARPPALAVRRGPHRVEYPAEAVAAMPPALVCALADSPSRVYP